MAVDLNRPDGLNPVRALSPPCANRFGRGYYQTLSELGNGKAGPLIRAMAFGMEIGNQRLELADLVGRQYELVIPLRTPPLMPRSATQEQAPASPLATPLAAS